MWIGWPGIVPKNDKEVEEIEQLLQKQKLDFIPIFPAEETIVNFYRFHELVLRPLFHNFKSLNTSLIGEEQGLWSAYIDVNKQYAKLATEHYHDEHKDLLWVHDTYMLLVPYFLRTQNIDAKIGLSMHAPFPSSDIYKTFLYRNEVLKSMMCCDLISFHIFESAKCFYTSTTRTLGASTVFKKGGFMAVQSHGREVMLRVSHIAIDLADLQASMALPEF